MAAALGPCPCPREILLSLQASKLLARCSHCSAATGKDWLDESSLVAQARDIEEQCSGTDGTPRKWRVHVQSCVKHADDSQ